MSNAVAFFFCLFLICCPLLFVYGWSAHKENKAAMRMHNLQKVVDRFGPRIAERSYGPSRYAMWHKVIHSEERFESLDGVLLYILETLLIEDNKAEHWRVKVKSSLAGCEDFDVQQLAGTDDVRRGRRAFLARRK